MDLFDVNVLVYAHREDSTHHRACRKYLDSLLKGESPFGLSDLVLSGFLRIATHPRVFNPPSALSDAFLFASQLRASPQRVPVEPGPRHWEIFERVSKESHARGNLLPDAYFAALAIENACEWVTLDRDYSRFAGLRCRFLGRGE